MVGVRSERPGKGVVVLFRNLTFYEIIWRRGRGFPGPACGRRATSRIQEFDRQGLRSASFAGLDYYDVVVAMGWAWRLGHFYHELNRSPLRRSNTSGVGGLKHF